MTVTDTSHRLEYLRSSNATVYKLLTLKSPVSGQWKPHRRLLDTGDAHLNSLGCILCFSDIDFYCRISPQPQALSFSPSFLPFPLLHLFSPHFLLLFSSPSHLVPSPCPPFSLQFLADFLGWFPTPAFHAVWDTRERGFMITVECLLEGGRCPPLTGDVSVNIAALGLKKMQQILHSLTSSVLKWKCADLF